MMQNKTLVTSPNIENVIREYFPTIVHMSLGTCRDGRPWVCEVHFVYDDQLNLYFRSLASRRHSQDIAANPMVAGNIVRQHQLGEYPLGVYFEGNAEMLTNGDERQKVAPLFRDRLTIKADILGDAENPDGHQFYKIIVENWFVFGKLDDKGGQKYQLKWNAD